METYPVRLEGVSVELIEGNGRCLRWSIPEHFCVNVTCTQPFHLRSTGERQPGLGAVDREDLSRQGWLPLCPMEKWAVPPVSCSEAEVSCRVTSSSEWRSGRQGVRSDSRPCWLWPTGKDLSVRLPQLIWCRTLISAVGITWTHTHTLISAVRITWTHTYTHTHFTLRCQNHMDTYTHTLLSAVVITWT